MRQHWGKEQDEKQNYTDKHQPYVLAVAALACILMQCYMQCDMGKDTSRCVSSPVAGTVEIIDGSQRLFYVKNVAYGL